MPPVSEHRSGIEMVHTGDIPAQAGMGSSSAFTVGLLTALYALTGRMTTKRQIAREAHHIEQDILKENVGSQDQVAAAFGGFNKIEFGGERGFYVSPLPLGQRNEPICSIATSCFFLPASPGTRRISRPSRSRASSRRRRS